MDPLRASFVMSCKIHPRPATLLDSPRPGSGSGSCCENKVESLAICCLSVEIVALSSRIEHFVDVSTAGHIPVTSFAGLNVF